VTGLLGGWLYVEAFGLLGDTSPQPFIPLLAVVTPIVAGLFGWTLTIHARRFFRGFSPALAFGVTLVAGLANGILIGGVGGAIMEFPEGFLWGVLGGGVVGVICSIPFLVPLVVSARLMRQNGRARPGTLVDRSDRRVAWAAIAPSASVAAFLVEAAASTWHPPTPTVGILAVLAAPLALGFLLMDLLAWRRAVRERSVIDDGARAVLDVGIGDDTVLRIEHARDAYRDADREVRVPRGSPVLAEAAIQRRIIGGIVASGITLFASYATVVTHLERVTPTRIESSTLPQTIPSPAVRVLYSRTESARRVELLGVHSFDRTAYVLAEEDGVTRVHAIDYQNDREVASWLPTGDDSTQWLLIARSVDPITAHPAGLPIVDSSEQAFAFTDSRSRLFVSADGRSRAVSMGPARDAMFAPSGTALAFVAGRRLQLADAAGDKPSKPVELLDPGAPLFTAPDRIFVVASGTSGDCVYQVDPQHLGPQAPIFCPRLENLVMLGDPQRKTAAVCGRTPHSGSHCTWLDLPSGAIKGRVALDRDIEPLTLGPNGLLVARGGEATVYVSLKDEGRFRVDVDPDAEIDARGGRWIDESGTLVALRHGSNEWDVLEIDVDRMIDGAARN